MKIDYKKLGAKIKKARQKENLTQETLAEILDLSASHLSHVENGLAKVSLPTIYSIAKVLNVSLDNLLGLEFENESLYVTIKEIKKLLEFCTINEKKLLIENLEILKLYSLKEYLGEYKNLSI